MTKITLTLHLSDHQTPAERAAAIRGVAGAAVKALERIDPGTFLFAQDLTSVLPPDSAGVRPLDSANVRFEAGTE